MLRTSASSSRKAAHAGGDQPAEQDVANGVAQPHLRRQRVGRPAERAPGGKDRRGRGGEVAQGLDNALVKALARAFRWQRLFESGRYANLTELAAAEKVTLPYLTSILQFAHLAPDLVEMLLDGRQPTGLTLRAILKDLPIEWAAQRISWLDSLPASGKSEQR
jgi:hypothetical protein